MIIINLNPHPMRLRINANPAPVADPSDIVVQPSLGIDGKSIPARVSSTAGPLTGDINGVPAYGRTAWGTVEGLPEPKPGTIYIVSALVGGRPEVTGRDDVFVPGTGPRDGAIRTVEGQIFAVTRLIKA